MNFALDTNAASYALREEGNVRRRISAEGPDRIGIPTLVIVELLEGANARQFGETRRRQLSTFLNGFSPIDFDARCAGHAADIASATAREGRPIGLVDALIAGVARANSLTLVTRNTEEFARVPGLMLEDWY